jgi:hypothetical protein
LGRALEVFGDLPVPEVFVLEELFLFLLKGNPVFQILLFGLRPPAQALNKRGLLLLTELEDIPEISPDPLSHLVHKVAPIKQSLIQNDKQLPALLSPAVRHRRIEIREDGVHVGHLHREGVDGLACFCEVAAQLVCGLVDLVQQALLPVYCLLDLLAVGVYVLVQPHYVLARF